ncbi:MAG: head-tail adaptor protein [Rhodospirillales bacterium]|nr:head-tail adaptor protein [Rhodospirillales bacterium]
MPPYKPPNPGDYNRRVTIQQQAPVTVDAWGTPSPAWAVVATTFAAFTAKTYQATALDGQPIIRRQAQYRMRRIPSTPITAAMRIVDTTESDATQTYSILDIQDIGGARREVLLICQLVLPDQGV